MVLVGHNIAADLPQLWRTHVYRPEDTPPIFDTMVAAHFQGYPDRSLKALVGEIYHKTITGFTSEMLEGSFPSPSLRAHNATDVIATGLLYEHFKQFEYPNSFALDMKFIPVLAGMMDHGFPIDVRRAKKLIKKYERSISKISLPFNPNSAVAVPRYFGLPDAQITTLEKHAGDPEIDATIAYKRLTKRVNYLEKYIDAADENGLIHATYHIDGTVTGRLSCANPPLHSAAKEYDMRSIFAAPPGYKFIIFDFDQGEYQIGAVLAGDAELVAKLKDKSPHQVAADMLGCSYAGGKTANFAALNLGEAEVIAKSCGVTLQRAQEFLSTYPLARYARRCVAFGVLEGYTQSPLGRTRQYTKPTEAVTMGVQGGLAEIGKAGAIRAKEFPVVHNEHDEYLWLVREGDALEAAREIKKCMERNVFEVKVSGGVFDNWGQALIKAGQEGCGIFV